MFKYGEFGGFLILNILTHMGVEPKIMVFYPPNHPFVHRLFHYFHHAFWGETPYFWKHRNGYHHCCLSFDWSPPQKKHQTFLRDFGGWSSLGRTSRNMKKNTKNMDSNWVGESVRCRFFVVIFFWGMMRMNGWSPRRWTVLKAQFNATMSFWHHQKLIRRDRRRL